MGRKMPQLAAKSASLRMRSMGPERSGMIGGW